MKKLWVLAGSVLLFFSCVTSNTVGTVFDDSIPVEQTAQIWFWNAGTITAYNDITVNWKEQFGSAKTIQIPAGDTLLIWDIKAGNGYAYYRGKDIAFRYNFLPQKKYLLMFGSKYDEAEEKVILGFRVYTYESGEEFRSSWKDRNAHFTELVPFLNYQVN